MALCGAFFISELLSDFVRAGVLYEDAEYHNAVFIATDEKKEPQGGMKKSTLGGSHFLRIHEDICEVCLCLDNDMAGQQAIHRITAQLQELGYDDICAYLPSHKTIAADLGLSVSTVKRALHDLEQVGCIAKSARILKRGGRTSNLYEL